MGQQGRDIGGAALRAPAPTASGRRPPPTASEDESASSACLAPLDSFLPRARDGSQRQEQETARELGEAALAAEPGNDVADGLKRADRAGAHEHREQNPADRAAGNQPGTEQGAGAELAIPRATLCAAPPTSARSPPTEIGAVVAIGRYAPTANDSEWIPQSSSVDRAMNTPTEHEAPWKVLAEQAP